MKRQAVNKLLRFIGVFVFWIALWEICALAVGKQVVLPTPFSVAVRLCGLLGNKSFYAACFSSVIHIFAGLLLGIIAGVLLAVITKASRILNALFSPAIEVIKATPVASFIIVLLFIFVKGVVPMLAAFLMVIPIIFMNVRRGLASVPQEKSEVAQIYGFGLSKKVSLLYLPSVLPYFSAGCKSALALSWKAGIAAEVICTPAGTIGTMLYSAKIYLESEELFAWTVVVIFLSVIIEKLVILALDLLPGGREKV